MLYALESSIWENMFQFQVPPLEKVIRTILVYLAIAIVVRLFGKRLLAQMNSLDLVVVLLLSNVVQNAIIGEDNSLVGGVLGAVVLVLFNWGMDRIAQHVEWFRYLLEGQRTDVVVDGEIQTVALRKMGLREQELTDALHVAGADHVSEVKKASLEPGGVIVVELMEQEETVSKSELERQLRDLRAYLDTRLPAPTPRA